MKPRIYRLVLLTLIGCSSTSLWAQSPVTAAKNPGQLFTSPDPKLHKIKQVVYHIQKDLLVHGHWELADKDLSEEYIQHNPNVSGGRKAVVDFFTKSPKS